jgi:hypothetical protein
MFSKWTLLSHACNMPRPSHLPTLNQPRDIWRRILGYHGGDYEGYAILQCDGMQSGRQMSTFPNETIAAILWRWEQQVPSKRCYLYNKLHGVSSQKLLINRLIMQFSPTSCHFLLLRYATLFGWQEDERGRTCSTQRMNSDAVYHFRGET